MIDIVIYLFIGLILGMIIFCLGWLVGFKTRDLRLALLQEENARMKCLRATDMLAEKLRKLEQRQALADMANIAQEEGLYD